MKSQNQRELQEKGHKNWKDILLRRNSLFCKRRSFGSIVHSSQGNHNLLPMMQASRAIRHLARVRAGFPRSNVSPIASFTTKGRGGDTLVPGSSGHHFGSLGDIGGGSSGPAAPWQAEHNQDVQRVTQKAMIYELIHEQIRTIEEIVPWFLSNMPPAYFHQVPERFRMDHMKAVAAIKDANMDLYLNLQAQVPDGRQVLTFIRPGTRAGTLLKMVEEHPQNYDFDTPLSRLHVFSTEDETMSLNMFVYGLPSKTLDRDLPSLYEMGADKIMEMAKLVQDGGIQVNGLSPLPIFEREALETYIQECTDTYIRIGSTDPARFLRHRMLFEEVSGTEGTAVDVSEASGNDAGLYWVDVAVANSMPEVVLENLCRLLYKHEFDVKRARLDIVPDKGNGRITLLRTLVSPVNGRAGVPDDFELLQREIKRSKWLDPYTMDLVFSRHPWIGVTRGEIITAFCSLLHPILAKENSMAYSKANIFEAVTNERFIKLAVMLADIFLDRFNPKNPLSEADMDQRLAEVTAIVDSDVEDRVTAEIFLKIIDVIKHTLKTNVYMENRYALGLRLDPAVMNASIETERELPFGVLFVHGRRFNAYHVRFRDISRGGMRLVTPSSPEQYALESARQYDECYGLAFAQQLKNKDIPEGGSKAVALINTYGMPENGKHFVMRKSVKAFTDTVLDLIVDTEETRENVVDYFKKKEVLYLGPDEQVIPDDINWVVKRAAKRGYGTPAAFMSSKPRAGINHKEYGVTSEGVNVYLDVALREVLDIDPAEETFTVKMTGGPDGDVAGNEIKILVREYGDAVKIVGIADHSGCAEDPDGLDHTELIRLVNESLDISNFDPTNLGESGVLHKVDTPEGVKARNSMHNRLEADAFLPCGGRPNTIDVHNCKQFLKEDGTASSPLIVEGANLFVTAEARQVLFDEAGVIIVKDSSANKGGVITSSYEICAAMLLSEEEFFQNKEQIVGEVLEKLRGLAKLEAELLFREFETFGGSLPEVSQVISNSINAATDALTTALDTLTEQDRESLLPLFRAHLPKTLADLAFDHVHERVPDQYIRNAISSCLASKMVYKEGTKFISAQPKAKLAKIALKYIAAEKEIADLLESLDDTDIPEEKKEELTALLKKGGVRTLLGVY